MRILILDTLYRQFSDLVYSSHPGLQERPSSEQLQIIYDYGFARADFLVKNLRDLGHEASQILLNVPALRHKIAGELGLPAPPEGRGWGGKARRISHALSRKVRGVTPFSRIESNLLHAEIESFRPDVILNTDVLHLSPASVRSLKAGGVRVIGECAYPIPSQMNITDYDAMLSALPPYVERFTAAGIRTLYWPHAFEPAAFQRISNTEKTDGVVFIGTVSNHHRRRLQLLEAIADRVPLRIFGLTPHGLSKNSPLYGRFQPPLWGYDMLRALARAKIALNVHAELAGDYAVNIRMFEVTGAGTLLLTDFKKNLASFFRLGEEVIAYYDTDDCLRKLESYLVDDEERRRIAAAGQARTLADHTYRARLKSLLKFLDEAGTVA